jgi:hypothetical protein
MGSHQAIPTPENCGQIYGIQLRETSDKARRRKIEIAAILVDGMVIHEVHIADRNIFITTATSDVKPICIPASNLVDMARYSSNERSQDL